MTHTFGKFSKGTGDAPLSLKGNYVLVTGNEPVVGKLRDVNLSSGHLVLDEVPWLNMAARKVEQKDGVLVPYGQGSLKAISKDECTQVGNTLGQPLVYLDSLVEIDGKHYGLFSDINWQYFVLKPSLVKVDGVYRTENDRPIFIPRSASSQIVPVTDADLKRIVQTSERESEIKRLRDIFALDELGREYRKRAGGLVLPPGFTGNQA